MTCHLQINQLGFQLDLKKKDASKTNIKQQKTHTIITRFKGTHYTTITSLRTLYTITIRKTHYTITSRKTHYTITSRKTHYTITSSRTHYTITSPSCCNTTTIRSTSAHDTAINCPSLICRTYISR